MDCIDTGGDIFRNHLGISCCGTGTRSSDISSKNASPKLRSLFTSNRIYFPLVCGASRDHPRIEKPRLVSQCILSKTIIVISHAQTCSWDGSFHIWIPNHQFCLGKGCFKCVKYGSLGGSIREVARRFCVMLCPMSQEPNLKDRYSFISVVDTAQFVDEGNHGRDEIWIVIVRRFTSSIISIRAQADGANEVVGDKYSLSCVVTRVVSKNSDYCLMTS